MTDKSVFDKILKKKNYTKEEVKEILLGTYEGFTTSWLKNHPKAMLDAKKEERQMLNQIITDFANIREWMYADEETGIDALIETRTKEIKELLKKPKV